MPNDEDHLENQSVDIPQGCVILEAKEAKDKHLLLVHFVNHVNLIMSISSKQFNSRRHKIASKLSSIYFSEGSSEAMYLAADSAIEVVKKVANNGLDFVVAIVRPLSHHEKKHEAMGFCLLNNVSAADDEFYNINAPWENERCGDADYFVVWDHI
ncbi:hypothetical protein JHK87_045218 [Glycine soja]|nr:hypothetical protein JHK87_045218 [Glycine soja]